MARILISEVGVEYELLGAPGAPAVAITPGGRFSKDTPGIRELGEAAFWRIQDALGSAASRVGVPRVWFDDVWSESR